MSARSRSVARRFARAPPDEVYALTAFLLYENGVIHEDDVMDAHSLPKVAMPNRDGLAMPAEKWKHGSPRLQGNPKPPQ